MAFLLGLILLLAIVVAALVWFTSNMATRVEAMLPPLLDGLEQVHSAGFLHRDIKPANIILDAHDNPTLIDFGASRASIAPATGRWSAGGASSRATGCPTPTGRR